MSELSEAVQNLRNMRESYDQLAGAAEAYNEGKPALAEAISAKGVEATATDSLATMAEKVMTISQDTYEIDGGDMYAKQLFGVANNDIVPGYWNLYDIMAQLLSDGRLVNYGGILLAEYYKGYDSLALSGAGAGGAYVVSDKDENGQFKMYTEDTTHTWSTEEDGKGNRWVAYCFADAGHDFEITDTNTSPRTIHIGRNVGSIKCLINTRISQIIVTDGNTLGQFNSNGRTHNFGQRVVIKNIDEQKTKLIDANSAIESIYVEVDKLNSGFILDNNSGTKVRSLIVKCREVNNGKVMDAGVGVIQELEHLEISGVESCTGYLYLGGHSYSDYLQLWGLWNSLKEMTISDTEQLNLYFYPDSTITIKELKKIHLGYKTNDRSKSVVFSGAKGQNNRVYVQDLVIKSGWCKPLNVSYLTSLTEENIVNHILNRLGDNTGQSALTITLGATNLAKLTAEEKAIATNKGFTLA